MRALLLIVSVLLAGCDVQTKSPAEGDDRVTMNADASGKVEFDFPFAEGEIKLPASMVENSDFDLDGVKLMPGGRITGFNLDTARGPAEVRLSFSAPVPPEQARAYFLQQFQEKGVSANAAGDSVVGTSKDGTAFTIRFSQAGTGTNGMIELRPREGS